MFLVPLINDKMTKVNDMLPVTFVCRDADLAGS